MQRFNSEAEIAVVSITVGDSFSASFSKAISIWLPITAVLGIASAVTYVLLFRKYSRAMVYISVYASLGFSFAIAVISFAAGAIASGIILLVSVLIMAAIFWWIRGDLKACAKLLSVSGKHVGMHG